jgi:pyruvate dehydrogenase E1 component beta subunit
LIWPEDTNMRTITYVQAIQEAMAEEMRRDPKVLLFGESVRGGNFEHTVGLFDEFGPDRVLDTPIAETAIAGTGIGSALAGYRPIAELMFADFFYVAADEILLKAAQWHFIHGGKTTMPVVFMAAAGGGLMLSNEHSRIPTGMIAHHPGLKLTLPSNPFDAKGLLKTAIRDDNPVVYLWHKAIMGMKGEVPEEEYTLPFGKAEIKREGRDVTVVAWSNMVNLSLKVAGEGIEVEVIDPRTLEPFDLETVLRSLEKTNRLVVVDEDTGRCSFAAEVATLVMEHGFSLLDAPVRRVCATNTPIAGGYMEAHVLPSQEKIKSAVQQAVAGQ